MRKVIALAITVLLMFSCSEENEFKITTFQAQREGDGVLFNANIYSAQVDENGVITIEGSTSLETITLVAYPQDATSCTGAISVGQGSCYDMQYNASFANFIDENNVLWSTNKIPDESVQVYRPDGMISITAGSLEEGTLSGRFYFNAFNPTGLNSVGFSEGVFNNIPFTTGPTTNYFTCVDAEEQVQQTMIAYNNADLMESAVFEQLCNAYVNALYTQIEYCGDVNGTIQETIDQLTVNNCQLTCEQISDNTATAQSDYNNATLGNTIDMCTRYIQYLNEQIDTCGDPNGDLQAAIDSLDCGDDDGDGVPNSIEDLNNNGDLTDDDTDGDLNADYLDEDDDDDGILTNDELNLDADGNAADTDMDGIPDYLDLDEDNDGILTADEDINADGNPLNDDTDGDGIPNYLDQDDDGDGVFTVYEGMIDTDNDGTPNYLDNDDDGDTILTIYEFIDDDGDGNPVDSQDFDSDGMDDYLDNDDDNDGVPTADENPDPNGDGNPDDAQNSDADSAPDYLDAN
jgi:hypothetical protein